MWIWYDTTTRDVIHVSAPPFTGTPPSGQAVKEIADVALPGPLWQLRMTADLTSVEIDPAKVPPPMPNINGFLAALRTTVFPDPIRRNTVMRGYPEMMPAIQMGDWPTVSALVQDSISATPTGLAITSGEHAALQAAWIANVLPGTCP